MIRRRRIAGVATVVVAALALAACSSSGGAQQNASGGGGGNAGSANTPRMKVAMITHGAAGDTFWDIVRKGAQAAAQKDNVQLVYSSDNQAANQANLVQNAIDQKVDGIAVTLAFPDAIIPQVAKANAAGIPVSGFNAGLNEWKAAGLKGYFGQDENLAGNAVGERLNSLNAKNVICVVMEQGNVALENRCDGIKKTFKGTSNRLNVTGTDMPSVQSTITAKLQQDKSIDYVVTLGAVFAITALKSVSDAGSSAKVVTFDTNKDLVAKVKDGSVLFAVDQQPYLQGYLAVDALWLYKNNGNVLGGGLPVLTGPSYVDKTNVDQTAKFAEAGTR